MTKGTTIRGTSMNNYLKGFWEYLQGLSFKNRCPNCGSSFFEKGEGGLVAEEHEDKNGRICQMEINFCLECLEEPLTLNIKRIKNNLSRWNYDEEVVACSVIAVERFIEGEISYSVSREKSER